MTSTTPPIYKEKDTTALLTPSTTHTHTEKPCPHGPSATPHLSAQLAKPAIQTHLQSLLSTLTRATQEDACLKCAADDISKTLSAFMVDARAAKKEGKMSWEEKKALKGEVKGLLKGIKADVKGNWHRRGQGEEEVMGGKHAHGYGHGHGHGHVRRGWYWKR